MDKQTDNKHKDRRDKQIEDSFRKTKGQTDRQTNRMYGDLLPSTTKKLRIKR